MLPPLQRRSHFLTDHSLQSGMNLAAHNRFGARTEQGVVHGPVLVRVLKHGQAESDDSSYDFPGRTAASACAVFSKFFTLHSQTDRCLLMDICSQHSLYHRGSRWQHSEYNGPRFLLGVSLRPVGFSRIVEFSNFAVATAARNSQA